MGVEGSEGEGCGGKRSMCGKLVRAGDVTEETTDDGAVHTCVSVYSVCETVYDCVVCLLYSGCFSINVDVALSWSCVLTRGQLWR